ncbi:hypothetical protein EIP91_005934 [Steccherinum ochraceum]|uniref:Pre-rRNA-processing protein RIX1 n=1 Tax=Steccherinum ochraceum TaxID=92696 RepID=A0A4V2MXE9_9APHY|nr:hypothetical protein EIP91_005934 [Steccherinum ochraceum]
MEPSQSLKTLLQVHLANDAHAVLHLPYVLSTLDAEALRSQEHLQKWIARLSSLLTSKDGGARWAGLCLAFQTAHLSKDLMVECAQTWVGATIPLLSKPEPLPVWKAAIRLMRRVFTGAMDVPEYQRQVCTPNVPKFSLALVAVGQKTSDVELKVLVFETLTHLIPVYPSLHRPSQNALSNFAMLYLNGSAPQSLPVPIVEGASKLYSVLHHMGGKVGAATQWRKSVDDTLSFCWGAISSLRTTFPANNTGISPAPAQGDPVTGVPLNLDRLRIGVLVLRDLLQYVYPDIDTLLSLTSSNKFIKFPAVSVTPQIHEYGCKLVDALVMCAQHLVVPHYSQLLFYLTHHLEQRYAPSHRLNFLRTTHTLLSKCGLLHDSLLPSRLARAVLPSVTIILAPKSEVQGEVDAASGSTKGRKGKKRARGYEGDEVFKMTRSVICPSDEEGQVVLSALTVLQDLLKSGPLSPAVHSLTVRVVLSLYISLPHIPLSLLSADVALHTELSRAVKNICVEFSSGTTSTMSKSLGLVVGTSMQNGSSQDTFRNLDLLLHPRVPPLVRSLPHLETLSLFRAEEGQEELEARQALHLGAHHELEPPTEPPTGSATPVSTASLDPAVRPPSSASQVPLVTSAVAPPTRIQPAATGLMRQSQSVAFQQEPPKLPSAPPSSSAAPTVDRPETHTVAGSSSSIQAPVRSTNPSSTTAVEPTPADVRMVVEDEEDEDEPMPSIDAESDSDEED